MKLVLLCLAVAIMFAQGQSYSESMSCSTVNGKTICNSEKGSGNTAGSSAQAMNGNRGSYQDSYAMTGNSGTGQYYESRSQRGNPPSGGFGPNQFFGPNFGPSGGNYGPNFGPGGGNYGPRSQASAGPNYGFDPFAFAGLPNPMLGGFGGAFAIAGRR